MTPETFDHFKADIQSRLVDARYDDPGLAPDLLAKVVDELGHLATTVAGIDACYTAGPDVWAEHLLTSLHHRAVSGVPYSEPQEVS